jgi:pimeloyl-ACP methyl ester carboxylesterase
MNHEVPMEVSAVAQEIVSATTLDGWDLSLYHYQPHLGRVGPYPVILCHGLASNKNSCDFGSMGTPLWERYSLAAFLTKEHADGGPVFDVWVPELRGCGNPTFDPKAQPKKYRWCLDDYVDYDVPAIISRVQRAYTERDQPAPPVLWVGKSMGGMIAYAYGETAAGSHNLKGVVTLGSPVAFSKGDVFLEFLTRMTPRNLSIPIRVRELIGKSTELHDHFRSLGINPENIDPEVFRVYLQVGFCNVFSSKVLSQFSLFFKHADFCRYPRHPWMYDIFGRIPGIKGLIAPYSYKEHLPEFTAPLLAIAGGHDKLAQKHEVQYAFDHVGSSDKTYLEFSKEAGYPIDYGHLDLNLGMHAREDVYPNIRAWLVKQSGM